MYETLRPELLTASDQEKDLMRRDPTYVVSWAIFSKNPLPYLEMRRPFILGLHDSSIWKPTIYHFFTSLLEDKNLLIRHYSQNIDGLDFKVAVPSVKLIPVHGSLSQVSCEGCGAEMDTSVFTKLVKTRIKDIYGQDSDAPSSSSPITCPKCSKALVKPSTVLYGRNLPASFEANAANDAKKATVVIVAGTSLTVFPAASLPDLAPTASRVVVNRDYGAGMTGIDFENNERDDIMLEGDCDSVFLDLIEELGWLDDLAAHRDGMCENSRALLDGRLKAVARSKTNGG